MKPTTSRPGAKLLSLRDAERETGLPKDSLRKLIATGALPVVELPHIRRVWIDRNDLDALIEQSKIMRAS
jgi:hypothetical protein